MGVFSRVQPLHLPHGTLLPGQSACLSSAPLQISIPHPAVWGSLCHGLQVYLNGDLETVPRLSGGIPLNGGDPMSPPKLCSPQPEKHVASPESVVVRVPQVCSAASSAAVGSRVLRAILTPRPSSAKEGTAWSFAPNALLSRWEGKPGQPHGIYAWGCPNAPGTLGGRREAPPHPVEAGSPWACFACPLPCLGDRGGELLSNRRSDGGIAAIPRAGGQCGGDGGLTLCYGESSWVNPGPEGCVIIC